jgi:hypothetical protein
MEMYTRPFIILRIMETTSSGLVVIEGVCEELRQVVSAWGMLDERRDYGADDQEVRAGWSSCRKDTLT